MVEINGFPGQSLPALAGRAQGLQVKLDINSSPPEQYGRRFADDMFRSIVVNEEFRILFTLSLECFSKGPIDSNPALV